MHHQLFIDVLLSGTNTTVSPAGLWRAAKITAELVAADYFHGTRDLVPGSNEHREFIDGYSQSLMRNHPLIEELIR